MSLMPGSEGRGGVRPAAELAALALGMVAVTLLAPALARADEGVAGGADAGAPSGPTVKVTGYVEAFYQFNFNQPSNLVTAYRGFDNRSNSITLSNAALDVTGALGPASARLALQVGHAPASYYLAEPTYPAVAGTGVSDPNLWRLIQQALVGYQAPVGRGLLVEAGIFLSPIGLEGLPSSTQWNESRSDLFFALPYYHAGVRATYPFTDRLTGVLYVTNGWNDIVNKNPYPCFAGSLTYAIPEALSVQLLYFGGVEDATGAPEGQPWRNLLDGTVTWYATRLLSFAAQADVGYEDTTFGRSSWYDGAAYARLRLLEPLYLAARVDHFHEHDAVSERGAASRLFFPADDVSSETLTLELRPLEAFSLRLEFRADQASAPIYFQGKVSTVEGSDVTTARAQQTLTLGAVAWF